MKFQHNPVYANVFHRFIASMIDGQIISLIHLYFIYQLALSPTLNKFIPNLLTNLAYIHIPINLIFSVLMILLLNKTGYTPGKWFCGIAVLTKDRKMLPVSLIIFRELVAKQVSAAILMLGYLNILIDPNHQAWHDHLSGSFVYQITSRLLAGIIICLLLLSAHIYLINEMVSHLTNNSDLIKDALFLFEPLTQLINR